MKRIVMVSLIMIFVFGFIGMTIASTLIHELSHRQDYKRIAKDGDVCILEFNRGALAEYSFNYNKNDTIEYNKITRYTEYKAYALTALIMALYIFSWMFVYNYIRGKK